MIKYFTVEQWKNIKTEEVLRLTCIVDLGVSKHYCFKGAWWNKEDFWRLFWEEHQGTDREEEALAYILTS